MCKDIINGIRKNKREVYPGGSEVLMVYIKRFLPWLAYRLARKVKKQVKIYNRQKCYFFISYRCFSFTLLNFSVF